MRASDEDFDLVEIDPAPASRAEPAPDEKPGWLTRTAESLGVRRARFDPGRRGLRALVAVAAITLLVIGIVAWHLRPVADPVAAPAAPPAHPTAAASPTPSLLVVAVAGRVRHPGLVRLPAGSRVADAIKAAGGLLPGTDVGLLNLARKVVDGEQILVGVTPPPQAAAAGGTPDPANRVNLNTATAADLDTLPGIGPTLADRIIAYRTQHGGFRSVDELKQVSGIGDARFNDLKDLVTI